MSEALEKQRTETLAQNRRGIGLDVLQRDAETNRKLYDALLQRTKEAGITGQLKASTARIVDTAEPPRRPVRPNRRNDLAVGFAAALLLAVGLVFTLEMFDTRIKSPDDIARTPPTTSSRRSARCGPASCSRRRTAARSRCWSRAPHRVRARRS
jgi:succinoglycan biosynthesis transport protein ExoP